MPSRSSNLVAIDVSNTTSNYSVFFSCVALVFVAYGWHRYSESKKRRKVQGLIARSGGLLSRNRDSMTSDDDTIEDDEEDDLSMISVAKIRKKPSDARLNTAVHKKLESDLSEALKRISTETGL